MKRQSYFDTVLLVLTFVVMTAAIIWALHIAPTANVEEGDNQRIFYFHLGSILPGWLAFFYVLYASIRYLKCRDLLWDRRGRAAGEAALAFSSIVLITGPIWGKAAWGVFWAWDARLTSALLQWMIVLGYVMLRRYMDDEGVRARVSSVLGIIGASMIPFVYMANRWFETQHPQPVIAGGEDSGIKDINMNIALLLAMASFSLLTFLFMRIGRSLLSAEARIKDIEARTHILEEEL